MKKKIKKKMHKILNIVAIFAMFLIVPQAFSETLEEKIIRIKANLQQTTEQQQQLEEKINQVEAEFDKFDQFKSEATGNAAYDKKIKEAKKQRLKNQQKPVEESQKSEPEKEEKTEVKAIEEKVIPYPMERNPQYAPIPTSGKIKQRRPFKRSEVKGMMHYASTKGSETLAFASEVQAYTGTTEQNIFLFSDNLANYCEIDTNSLDKMEDCLNKVLKNNSEGSQTLRNQTTEMMQDSLIDTASKNIAQSLEIKNGAAGFEKDVLLPLQERSSDATDERGDIEVMTFTNMEALKVKYKLLHIYASQLSLNALKDFSTYELNSSGITDINDAYNQEKGS